MEGVVPQARGLHSSTFQLNLTCFGHTSPCSPLIDLGKFMHPTYPTKFSVRLIRGSEIMRNQPTDYVRVRTGLIAIDRWSVGVERIQSVVGRR